VALGLFSAGLPGLSSSLRAAGFNKICTNLLTEKMWPTLLSPGSMLRSAVLPSAEHAELDVRRQKTHQQTRSAQESSTISSEKLTLAGESDAHTGSRGRRSDPHRSAEHVPRSLFHDGLLKHEIIEGLQHVRHIRV